LVVPPLRERREDIPLLFEYFARLAAEAYGRELRPIPATLFNRFTAYNWPGNVRELRNAAERYALGLSEPVTAPWQSAIPPGSTAGPSLAEQVQAFERAVIEQCLTETGGKISEVMERLDIPRRTLSEKMARLGLDRRNFTDSNRPNSADETAKN
jgi:two-component system C4-dicarboxylate transport response regulator DctD